MVDAIAGDEQVLSATLFLLVLGVNNGCNKEETIIERLIPGGNVVCVCACVTVTQANQMENNNNVGLEY